MSDFLKKFSDKSYNDINKVNFSEDSERKEPNITNNQVDRIKKEEVIDVTPVETQVSKAAMEPMISNNDTNTTFQTSNTREEVFVRDHEKILKRKKNILIGILCTILILGAGFFGYRKLNEVRVPQFIKEKTLNDVQVWAAKYKLDIDYTTAYSKKVDDGYVVSQSKKEGSLIQKGNHFEVVLSKGANPDEPIKVPDFMKMSLTEIEAWKQKQKATNVVIEKVFDDTIEKSKTIRVEYKTDGIDASNYRRKDKINIVVSKGKESYEKNIEMPDFKDKSKAEVETWAKQNEVVIEFSEEANSKVMEGNVISQDISAKTKIAKKDTVKIVISRGKISHAPNFMGLDETQSQVEASKASVPITIVYYYSNQVPTNGLISQSLPAGTEIKEQTISLTYSLGKPYIGNFDGDDVYNMVKTIDEMNGKGAHLTYDIIYVNSAEKKGTVASSNYKGCFVNIGTHIVISVSNGIG